MFWNQIIYKFAIWKIVSYLLPFSKKIDANLTKLTGNNKGKIQQTNKNLWIENRLFGHVWFWF